MKQFEEIEIGDSATLRVEVTLELIREFAEYSGDNNPLHLDPNFAVRTRFKRPVAHGLSYASLFSNLVGTKLPGPGALWTSQSFLFHKPACIGDSLELKVKVSARSAAARTLTLECSATNQDGEVILTGTGEVTTVDLAPVAVGPDAEVARRTLIIGGSRGIGAAIVSRLSAKGHSIVFTYNRSRQEAEHLCAELERTHALAADASQPDDASRVIRDSATLLGEAPDTIIFCASERTSNAACAEAPFAQFERQLATGLGYAHAILAAAVPTMIKRKRGCIVGIGSTHAIGAPPPGLGSYVVAKSALMAYLRSVAIDYGRHGIRANIVAPSMTETAYLSDLPDHERKVAALRNPRRRLATANDVAGAVAYLVSDDADFVNGETLIVSGGSVVR